MNLIDSVPTQEITWYSTHQAEKWLQVSADLLGLVFAFWLTGFLLQPSEQLTFDSWLTGPDAIRVRSYLVLMALAVIAFWVKGHYSKRRPYSNEVREVLHISLMLALVDAALVFFGKWEFSRVSLAVNWLLAPCFLLMARTALKLILMRAGGWTRPMVIIGWGGNALETALAFEGEKLMGYSLLAILVPNDRRKIDRTDTAPSGSAVPWVSLGEIPEVTLERLGHPHVVMALEEGGIEAYQDIIQDLGRRSPNLQIVPPMRGLPLYGMEVNHFFAHEVLLLTVRNNLARRFPQLVKRIFDVTVSLCILVVGAPVLLWIAAKVAASGRPIFYGHQRQGQHNRPFPCYKFRTMAPDADKLLAELLERDPAARAEWERDFKLKNDPRITQIGHFLRRTSLDELPQLWNVLKGDMSLVGPRPVVAAELERYGNQVDYYLEAKPGITGLWQISGRNDITYEARVHLDAWYVKNWSLFNDIVILFRTVKVIFRKDGAY